MVYSSSWFFLLAAAPAAGRATARVNLASACHGLSECVYHHGILKLGSALACVELLMLSYLSIRIHMW